MKNNFITKIIGATLAFAMMIGGAVGINAVKQAKEVDAADGDTTAISVFDYATDNSWASGTKYTSMSLGNYINCSMSTSTYTGTYHSTDGWKVYETDSGTFTISASNNAELSYVTIEWASAKNNGCLKQGSNTFASNTRTAVSGTSLVFTASHSSGTKVGQVGIKTIRVEFTYTSSKVIQANSVDIKSGSTLIFGTYEPEAPYYTGETLNLSNSVVVYQAGDDYEDGLGVINWSSSNTNIATITNGVVTFVSAGTTTITATAVDKGVNNTTVSASFILDIRNILAVPGSVGSPYTVDEARSAIDSGEGITGVYATGIVSEIVTAYSTQYHNITFNISATGDQEEDQLQAYRCEGEQAASIDIGDTVVVSGNLKKYNSTYEFDQGCSLVTRTPAQYSVTYNANGATSGTVPVDNTQYARNAQVTLATNTGNLSKSGYTFNGWNTKADPSENGAAHYNAGAQIQITRNLVLYVEWLSLAPSITVQANLSGYTGQSVDLDFSYGNIANESNISVVAADSKVTVGDLIAEGGLGAVTITFNTAGNTSLSFRNNGEELAVCSVVVNQSEISITGLSSKGKVQIGATLNLGSQITVNHSGIYSGDVVWESGDSNIATVSDSGVVTGVSVGQTTITVTSFDKLDVYQSCLISVFKGPIYNTLNLAAASYDSSSDELVEWSCDYAEMTNAVGTGSTKPNNYLGGANSSTRMYKNNVMTITPKSGYIISSVEFTATTNGYATALKNSAWTNAATVSNDTLVTVTPIDGSIAFGATIGATCGFTSVKIFITPNSLLKTASVIKTISGVESNEGATVTNVALRFGGVIPVSTWNQINSNWAITDFGIMFARGSMLTARSLDSLEKVFRNDPADVAMVHRGAVGTPNANGDHYIFTARLNLEEVDYDEVFYAAPFIVAGGEYYFLQEMHYSVRTLAEECLTSGESTLSQAALTTLKGNN